MSRNYLLKIQITGDFFFFFFIKTEFRGLNNKVYGLQTPNNGSSSYDP